MHLLAHLVISRSLSNTEENIKIDVIHLQVSDV